MFRNGRRAKILYVEDHEDTLELVSIVLRKNKFDVTTANTFEDGNQLAHTSSFDLYLLDLWLPDGEGLQLARLIREFDPNTPIVFFSAAAYEADRREALEAGAQAFLTKPATPSELCDVINALVNFHPTHNTTRLLASAETRYLQ